MTSSSANPTPSSSPSSHSASRPSARPGVRPVSKPAAASSKGPMIGLTVAAVLAVAGLGAAGYLFTQQGPLKAENDAHRKAALEAARAANIAIDTNTAIDWATLWPRITATFTTLRNESDRQRVRLREMEQELEAAAGLQTSLQAAQAAAQRTAQQLSEANAQIETLRKENAQRVADLEARLAAALKAVEEFRSKASAAEASMEGPAVEAEAAAEAVVPSEDATAVFGQPEEVVVDPTSPVPARVETAHFHTFPGRRSDFLASAGYDENTGTMTIRLHNGDRIDYPNFPRDLYEQFVTAPTFETFYRIKIMGQFPSTPDDKTAVRAARRR